MEELILPYSTSELVLPSQSKDFHKEKYRSGRLKMLSELRQIPGIVKIIKSLNPETVYKFAGSKKGLKLVVGNDNLVSGVLRNADGSIGEHAKWIPSGQDLGKIVGAMGSQIMLVSIVMQLKSIENKVDEVLNERHLDRIAEVEGITKSYHQMLSCQKEENQIALARSAIIPLNQGLEKLLKSLKEKIKKAPSSHNGFFDNIIKSKASKAHEQMSPILEEFATCLRGVQVLSNIYTAIGEPAVASEALASTFQDIKKCGIKEAYEKARLIDARKMKVLPEKPFKDFLDSEIFILNHAQRLKCRELNDVIIEFKPKELGVI